MAEIPKKALTDCALRMLSSKSCRVILRVLQAQSLVLLRVEKRAELLEDAESPFRRRDGVDLDERGHVRSGSQ